MMKTNSWFRMNRKTTLSFRNFRNVVSINNFHVSICNVKKESSSIGHILWGWILVSTFHLLEPTAKRLSVKASFRPDSQAEVLLLSGSGSRFVLLKFVYLANTLFKYFFPIYQLIEQTTRTSRARKTKLHYLKWVLHPRQYWKVCFSSVEPSENTLLQRKYRMMKLRRIWLHYFRKLNFMHIWFI